MFSFRPFTTALLSFACTAAFAGTMGPVCTPGNVTVPCENNAWDIGLTALYFKPIEDADFGYRVAVPEGHFNHYLSWDHDYNWGFKLEGSYHYHTGSDVNLNWNHVKAITNGDYVISNRTFHHVLQWDAVNGEFGQTLDINALNSLRYHGGFQFVRLFGSVDNYLNNQLFNNGHSSFNGFGPRIGLDMAHWINHGFQIYAKAAATVAVGTSKFYDAIFFNFGSKDAIVPELEGKLGVDWSHQLAQGLVTLDAGFMWLNYFNGIHSTLGKFSPINGFESDFGMAGPYLGLKYIGNI